MTFFGLKLGQALENRAAHSHQEFPGVLPQDQRSVDILTPDMDTYL